jgi:hypothetical protein
MNSRKRWPKGSGAMGEPKKKEPPICAPLSSDTKLQRLVDLIRSSRIDRRRLPGRGSMGLEIRDFYVIDCRDVAAILDADDA